MLIILIEKMSTLQHADWQKHTLPFLLTPMDGQSVSLLWSLLDGLFVWAQKLQTQQWPAPDPHNGPPHKGPHWDNGAVLTVGVNSWAEVTHLHTSGPPPHTHTESPHPLLQVSSCVCGTRRKQRPAAEDVQKARRVTWSKVRSNYLCKMNQFLQF